MRECKFCGRVFQEENGHQIFCSDYCRREQRNLGKRIRRKEKISQRTYKPRRSHLEWTDEDVQNRINTKSSKIVYIGGYKDSESPMYIMCNDCGNIFKWSARGLRKQSSIQCDNCRRILSDKKAREHKEEVLTNIEARKQNTKERREAEYIRTHSRICQRCGKEYSGTGKYCSKICQRRQSDSNKTHLRRIRINNNYHDNISTILLAKRDKDICWLCKKKVDWEDYQITKEGYFIAGENYPSQDHVVALANGGTHTWDNVRLAHNRCNSNKSDKLYGEKENGQIILFC